MSENNIILKTFSDGSFDLLQQTTLMDCNKDEQYLENLIANNPQILRIENRQTGIYSPFKIFRQLTFKTPQNRIIRPDIILLSASGHVTIVEVKLFGNPELNDRRVISQIIDYAGSFSSKTDTEIFSIFNIENKYKNWYELISQSFNSCDDIEELSQLFLFNLKSGNICLIIACDKIPPGLKELLKGISKQSTLEFTLDLLEITPYLLKSSDKSDIFFVPNKRLSTEIVARTSVIVYYKNQDEMPSLEITTTSLDDIQENVNQINLSTDMLSKNWTIEEIENYINNSSNTFLLKLFILTRDNSYENVIIAKGKKKNPAFGCYIRGKRINDIERIIQLYNININANLLKIYFNMLNTILNQDIISEFKNKLVFLFGQDFDETLAEPTINLDLIEQHYLDFIEIIEWIINQSKISMSDK